MGNDVLESPTPLAIGACGGALQGEALPAHDMEAF